MDVFTAAEAAKWLGVSREAVDLAAREGRLTAVAGDGPRQFTREALEAYHRARVQEKVAALARGRETPLSVARRVRERLHSSSETGLPRSFASRLSVMPSAWRQLFSKAELAAACLVDGEGCRWCRVAEYCEFLGLRPVQYDEVREELFGGPPCRVCAPGLYKPLMAAAAADVHRGRPRPSRPSVPPSTEQVRLAEEWARAHAVTAAAKPVQDDGGRALVARRRREVQARLTAAKRAGDQKYAIQLRQTLAALTADAARVDGRPVTASARPGKLRCGHALSVNCACPRRASR